MADESDDPPPTEESTSPGGVIIPPEGTRVWREPERLPLVDDFQVFSRNMLEFVPNSLLTEFQRSVLEGYGPHWGGAVHSTREPQLVPVDDFYNVFRQSPHRIPDGLFLFADGHTVWCNGAHRELLRQCIRDQRFNVLDVWDRPGYLNRNEPTLLGHQIKFIETGIEGRVTFGVYYMSAENEQFRQIIDAMNQEGTSDNIRLLRMFEVVSSRWFGFGRVEIASADDDRTATTEIIIRHHPRSHPGIRKHRWTMSLAWEMVGSVVHLGKEGIESFWKDVADAYEEECRRAHYRAQEAQKLGDKITEKLAHLREAIAEGRHRDNIDLFVRQISDLESRLRDGTYWDEC